MRGAAPLVIIIIFLLTTQTADASEPLGQELDSADMLAGEIAPGFEWVVGLPYHVQLQYAGDDEYVDGKLALAGYDFEAGLGDDKVVFTVKRGGTVVYEDILGSKQSFFGTEYKGTVGLTLRYKCAGTLEVYYKGNKILEINAGDKITVYKDDDTKIQSTKQYEQCYEGPPPELPSSSNNSYVLALAGGLALVLIAIAIIVARGV